jgi:tetratricopeptide (TPR) repeat protein
VSVNQSLKRFGKTLGMTFWALIISVAAADAMPVLMPIPCLIGFLLVPTLLTVVAIAVKDYQQLAKPCHQLSIAMDRLFACIPANPYSVCLSSRYVLYAAYLLEKGLPAESEQAGRQALAVAEKNSTDPSSLVDALLVLSDILAQRGKGDEGWTYVNRAIEMCDRLGEEAPLEIAEKQILLAPMLRQNDRHGDAEKLLSKAITLVENSEVGPTPAAQFSVLAGALNNLACIYDELSRYDEGAELFRRALNIKEKVSPQDGRSLAAAHSNLGYALVFCNKLEEAEIHLNQAQEITQREKVTEKTFIWSMQSNFGHLRLRQGRLAEGLKIAHDNQKELDAATVPCNSTQVDNCLVLAMLYREQGNREESQKWFEKCLDKLREQKPLNLKVHDKIQAEHAKLLSAWREPAALELQENEPMAERASLAS